MNKNSLFKYPVSFSKIRNTFSVPFCMIYFINTFVLTADTSFFKYIAGIFFARSKFRAHLSFYRTTD